MGVWQRRATLTALVAGASLLASSSSRADDRAEDKALATSLFHEAKALLDAGEIAPACRKLEESFRLEPAGGTLLNLAVCHEREGKTATAWSDMQRARAAAERDGRQDRVAFADERIRAIEPTLSKLVIIGPADVGSALLEIAVDDRVVGRAAWGTAMPLDPGAHIVSARAPGKKPWHAEVDLGPNGDAKTVTIPALDDEEATVVAPVIAPAVATRPLAPLSPLPSKPDRTVPLVVAGSVAVGGLALGTIFGLRAFSLRDAGADACVTNPCSAASEALNDSAKTSADVSTVAFTVALVAAGVGAWLWLSSASSSRSASAPRQY